MWLINLGGNYYTQAYRNMEMTRECISFIFDPRDTLFPLHTGFSFVGAAVARAILERIFGFEPSSETTASRYLKFVIVPSFCPFTLLSIWMSLSLFVVSFVLSALISILYYLQILSRLSHRVSSYCSYLRTSKVQSTLFISTLVTSNNRLSGRDNLILVLT